MIARIKTYKHQINLAKFCYFYLKISDTFEVSIGIVIKLFTDSSAACFIKFAFIYKKQCEKTCNKKYVCTVISIFAGYLNQISILSTFFGSKS